MATNFPAAHPPGPTEPPALGVAGPTDPPAFEDGLFRQRERTVDNIKRIYAVVYSISFTNILRDIFDYAEKWLDGGVTKGFTPGMELRLLMLLVFGTTVSVFAYQADKFLDLRYALRPSQGGQTMPFWDKWDFAIDAGSLIVTLIPFTMMSYAFSDTMVDRYGIFPFFLFYLLELGVAVLLLLVVRWKYLLTVGNKPPSTSNGELTEETRYAALSIHWFVTDGVTALVMTVLFWAAEAAGPMCGASLHPPQSWFVTLFVVVALIRNVVDYRAAWPFLYMNSRSLTTGDLTFLMRRVASAPLPQRPTLWDLTGVLSLAAFVVAGFLMVPALGPAVCPK